MTGVYPSDTSPDVWNCVWGGRTFASKKYYDHCFKDVLVDDAFSCIWRSNCTNKWRIFVWLLLADCLNTRNMLRRRNYELPDNVYSCMLCTSPPKETVSYLFFKCPFAMWCRNAVGLTWPGNDCRLDLLHAGKANWSKPLIMEIFTIAVWGIWKERNNFHFRGITPSYGSWLTRFKVDISMMVHRTKDSLHPFIHAFVTAA